MIPRPPRMMFCVGRCTGPGDEGYELCGSRCCLLEGHEGDCWCGRQRCAEEMSIARATDTPRGILSTLTMLPQPPRPRGLCSLQCVEGRPCLLRAGHWGFHCCFRSECQCAPLEVDQGFGVRDTKVKVKTTWWMHQEDHTLLKFFVRGVKWSVAAGVLLWTLQYIAQELTVTSEVIKKASEAQVRQMATSRLTSMAVQMIAPTGAGTPASALTMPARPDQPSTYAVSGGVGTMVLAALAQRVIAGV